MPTRTANAVWEGNLRDGKGNVHLGSGSFDGQYSFKSRFEEGSGTNPEELIAAAHAGCYSMALSNGLATAGFTPDRVETTAKVFFGQTPGGFAITKIELDTEAKVPNIDEATFQAQAETAKKNCPVSKALAAVEISLNAKLVS
jgi:osmotically inducible protein OsmC